MATHGCDMDCAIAGGVDPMTGDCAICGVSGSREAGRFYPSCERCTGERFHAHGCPNSDEDYAVVAAGGMRLECDHEAPMLFSVWDAYDDIIGAGATAAAAIRDARATVRARGTVRT